MVFVQVICEINCQSCLTHQMLCTRLLVLVAKHILGKLAAVYLTEHKDALTKPSRFSHVAEHSKNFGHSIDWFGIKIITKDNITTKRVIKETLTIRLLKPSMNAMQSSAQLHVFC